MENAKKFKMETRDGLFAVTALIFLVAAFAVQGGGAFLLVLPLLLGLFGYVLVTRLAKSPRELSDIITVLTVAGTFYTLFLLLQVSQANLPGYQAHYWRWALYLDGDTRGALFIVFLIFNHLAWSFNIKNYFWIVRAPMSFVFFLAIMILSSLRTWLILPPALIIFLLLIPSPRRARVIISFVPSLMAAFFITPVLGMTSARGQLLDSIIWVMGGAVLSIVGSVFISIINRTSPYQKAFFFVVFFAFFVLFTSVYFYALLAFSTPAGEGAPDLLRIVPRQILKYFQDPEQRASFPGLEGAALWAAWLLAVPWLFFIKERYREYRLERDAQYLTLSAGLMISGALILFHTTYAPALLVGWPALFVWPLLGTRLHLSRENLPVAKSIQESAKGGP